MKEEIKVVHLKSNGQSIETWISLLDGEVVGHIYMECQSENKIKFLDAWVHPNHRRKGIYRKLWETRWEYVNDNYKGYLTYAWCKENSLPLLIEKGFSIGEVVTYVEKKI